MRSFGVVVNSPFFNQFPSSRQAREEVLVEALISEATIEALDKEMLQDIVKRKL